MALDDASRALVAQRSLRERVLGSLSAGGRRAELIEIKTGAVFARSSGDPTNPLVLYVNAALSCRLPWTAVGCRWLPLAAVGCHGIAWRTAMAYHRLPWIVMADHRSPRLVRYVHDGTTGANSSQWNTLMTSLSLDKRESTNVLKAEKAEKLARAKSGKGGDAEGKVRSGSGGGEKSSTSAAAAAAVAAQAGAEEDEEDVEFDDRFAVLRGKLSKALQRRQREIMQTLCSLCSSLLLNPTRLTRCRHVICRLCVERSIFYHRECPVCATPCDPPEIDAEHDAVMQLRMRHTFREDPVMALVSSFAVSSITPRWPLDGPSMAAHCYSSSAGVARAARRMPAGPALLDARCARVRLNPRLRRQAHEGDNVRGCYLGLL